MRGEGTAAMNVVYPRMLLYGGLVNDQIYAIWNGSMLVNVKTVQVLDPNDPAPVWTPVADLPEACSSSQAFGFDSSSPYKDPRGRLLAGRIVSGCGVWASPNQRVYAYNVASNTWDPFPALQMARRDQAAAFIPPASLPPGRHVRDVHVGGIWGWWPCRAENP